MQLKSMLHRLCKILPQSPELARSQDVDNCLNTGAPLDRVVDIDLDDTEKPMIEGGSGIAKLAQDHGVDDLLTSDSPTYADLEALLWTCPGCKVKIDARKQAQHAASCKVPIRQRRATTPTPIKADVFPDPFGVAPGTEIERGGVKYVNREI